MYELLVRPHYWAKTVHGLHLNKDAMEDAKQAEDMKDIIDIKDIGTAQSFGFIARAKALFAGNVGAGSVLVFASLLANFLNLVFNVILGRSLSLEDFATVTLFNTILNILAVALGALGSSVIYKTAFLVGQNRSQASKRF